MSDIVLSAATRNSLLAAQKTATLLDTTQGHLATGKKVNSALDNPLNFFAAAALDSRAGDLNTLLDSISNGIQTIQAASHAITSIQKLVDSAKSTANQALSTTISTTGTATTAFGTVTNHASTLAAGTATGTATVDGTKALSNAGGGGFAANDTLTVGSHTYTFTAAGTTTSGDSISVDDTLSTFLAKVQTDLGGTGTAAITGGKVVITAGSPSSDLVIGGSAVAKLGLTAKTYAHTGAAAFTDTELTSAANVSFKVNGTAVSGTIPAGSTAKQATDYLNSLANVPAGTFGIDVTGKIVLNGSADVEITDGPTKTALGLSGAAGTQATELTVNGAATRASLAKQYNDLLIQIDQLAGDAAYNGVNLVNSHASTNKLHIAFNERDTSNLDIQGEDARAVGLGLTAIDVTSGGTGNFQADTDIKSVVTALTAATAKLRSYASDFGSNLTVVQNRQDFTKNIINTLQTGSANLVNADLNEEAANSQALSTRQSLAISSLSLANQSQQAVLKLLQ